MKKNVENLEMSNGSFFTGIYNIDKKFPTYKGYFEYFCSICGVKNKIGAKGFIQSKRCYNSILKCQKCTAKENVQKKEFKEKQSEISKKRWEDGKYDHLKDYLILWGKKHCSDTLLKSKEEKRKIALKKIETWFSRDEKDRKEINKKRIVEIVKYKNNFPKDKTFYQKYEWKNISRIIRTKNKNICFICGKKYIKRELDVHHIIPLSIIKNNEEDNLVVLCKSCHRKIDARTAKFINEGNFDKGEINNFARKIIQENKENNNK